MVILSQDRTDMVDMENVRSISTERGIDGDIIVWATLKRTDDSLLLGRYNSMKDAGKAVEGLHVAIINGELGYKMP